MPLLSLKLTGLSEALAAVRRWHAGAFVAALAPQAGSLLLTQLRFYIAVRTGATQASLNVQPALPHLLFGGSKVAGYLYHGTQPHIIAARNARFLRFEGQGGTVYRRMVHHPGTGGTNYPLAAWVDSRDAIAALASDTARHLLGVG